MYNYCVNLRERKFHDILTSSEDNLNPHPS